MFFLSVYPMEEAWRKLGSVSQNQCHHNLICLMEELKREVRGSPTRPSLLKRFGGR